MDREEGYGKRIGTMANSIHLTNKTKDPEEEEKRKAKSFKNGNGWDYMEEGGEELNRCTLKGSLSTM